METHDQDNVVRRLRSLGNQPVEPHLADQHASYLRAATPAAGRSRMRPLMAGALLAGAVLGGTGLAAALPGSLPEQAGSVAKSALAAVKLVDDDSRADKTAKAAEKAAKSAEKSAAKAAGDADGPGKVGRFLAGCTAGTPPVAFVGNHGQYVKAHPDDPATADVNERQVAAESNCGKPVSALAEADGATDKEKAAKATKAKDEADATDKAEDAETPKPADAGRPDSPGKSEEEHPPATAVKEQGSENRSTENGKSGDAGNSADHRPDGVGPTTTTAG